MLENDRVIADLKAYLAPTFGEERQERWAIFEQVHKMGEPEYLSRAPIEELGAASQLVKELFGVRYTDGTVRFDVDLPPHAIAAVTLELTLEPSIGAAVK